jgi:hypothetical protein
MVDDTSLVGNETLEELLFDPIVWLVMKSDRVTKQEVSEILRSASRKLASEPESANQRRGAYRPGVGIMLVNPRNEVFVGRRNDVEGEAWRCPKAESTRAKAHKKLRSVSLRKKSGPTMQTS